MNDAWRLYIFRSFGRVADSSSVDPSKQSEWNVTMAAAATNGVEWSLTIGLMTAQTMTNVMNCVCVVCIFASQSNSKIENFQHFKRHKHNKTQFETWKETKNSNRRLRLVNYRQTNFSSLSVEFMNAMISLNWNCSHRNRQKHKILLIWLILCF